MTLLPFLTQKKQIGKVW